MLQQGTHALSAVWQRLAGSGSLVVGLLAPCYHKNAGNVPYRCSIWCAFLSIESDIRSDHHIVSFGSSSFSPVFGSGLNLPILKRDDVRASLDVSA